MAQFAIDQSVRDLADTMQNVYSFVDAIEAVPSKIRQLEDVIRQIFVQTAECAIFIQEYSGHGFAGMRNHTLPPLWHHAPKVDLITGRLLRETMGASTSAKVAGMVQSFNNLRGEFDTGVAVQTAVLSFRIQEDVTTLRE